MTLLKSSLREHVSKLQSHAVWNTSSLLQYQAIASSSNFLCDGKTTDILEPNASLVSRPPSSAMEESALSVAQLLDSRPGAVAQMWHADNISGGITVVVAMCDISRSNGPTALYCRSRCVACPCVRFEQCNLNSS
eukprot:m.70738 g.70738  ORF g.70738 m.70738 type:complete len:135 (+) comp16056_c0_seq5:792-1196(+)